jgi:hypothetical protein
MVSNNVKIIFLSSILSGSSPTTAQCKHCQISCKTSVPIRAGSPFPATLTRSDLQPRQSTKCVLPWWNGQSLLPVVTVQSHPGIIYVQKTPTFETGKRAGGWIVWESLGKFFLRKTQCFFCQFTLIFQPFSIKSLHNRWRDNSRSFCCSQLYPPSRFATASEPFILSSKTRGAPRNNLSKR